ncbi:phospholipase A2 inhibitor gamma subunit B-like [Heteronotia binoei]|uniref:phospholipase A2 inhibitor gamma subunit B-like n=1 Tax=Heteronotia binoei TaxID=13085 RepID=UPI00292EEA95|nr:phospholipase A2 inhibitor gamma subunit B-like [Heteronotia binoei]
MHFLLILCFLASYITLGLSLSCETCIAFMDTCTGNWETCPPEKNSCSFIQMEASGLMQVKSFMKTCIRSRDCEELPYSLNLGRAGQMLTRITCCTGDECQKSPPALPPINTTPNGRKCPSCYLVHSHECKEEMAECAGDENYCFEVFGTANIGGAVADMVMKGCTSKTSCNRTLDSDSLGAFQFVSKSSCTPALGAASSVQASFGLLLQAFMGLLLLKALS